MINSFTHSELDGPKYIHTNFEAILCHGKKVTAVGFEPVTLDGPGGGPPGPTTIGGGRHALIIKLKAMSN